MTPRTGAVMSIRSPATSLTLLDKLRLPADRGAWAEAWERFVPLYTPILLEWAKREGLQPADAEDVKQQILEKLVKLLPAYSPGANGSFGAWLHQITRNQCRDFRRRVATRRLPDGDGLSGVGDDSPQSAFVEAEYRSWLVKRALELIRAEFSEQTASAFEQVVIQSRPAAEVAAALGITANAVYLAQNRVLTRLRERLDGFLE